MNKGYKFVIVLISAFSSLLFHQIAMATYNKTSFLNDELLMERELIKKTIEGYFDARYTKHKTLNDIDLEQYVSKSERGMSFLNAEKEKLEVELFNTKKNKLRYADYKVFLDFKEIIIDAANQSATVLLQEGHDVVFEISAPTVSSLRNLKHKIVLEKKDNGWRIISDHYEDELWRFIRQSRLSTSKVIALINQKVADQKQLISSGDFNIQKFSKTSLNTGELAYNRVGASDYADKWALDRNPEYDSFDEDCTNFVSQAIHEGGGAPMVSADEGGVGAPGWYYNNIDDRAMAWTWVDGLYNFIVNEKDIWPGGPEGVEETNLLNLNKGDIVQFKWSDDDPYWMHSVIIVGWEQSGGNLIHLFDSHSSDRYHYPLESISYFQRRLIRITRVEGYL